MIRGDEEEIQEGTVATFYSLLGIGAAASPQEILDAYRQLAEMYLDPELVPPDWEPITPDMFNLITQAFRVLSDERLRKEYDQGLQAPSIETTKDSSADTPQTVVLHEGEEDIPEAWRKEREYFEENFEEIFKPVPKVNLVATEEVSETDEELSLLGWEADERPVAQDVAFGKFPGSDITEPEKAPPQARRVVPTARVFDPFQIVMVGGIFLLGCIIIIEVVYFQAAQ